MTESNDGKSEGLSPPVEEKGLRQAATRLTQAVTGSASAITGGFRALVGKSSGSIRAIKRNAAELYEIAPDVIRGRRRSLDYDEVNEIVSRLVHGELRVEHPEWTFLRRPELRDEIATREIQSYIQTQVRGRRLRRKVADDYWDRLSKKSIWANPLSEICVDELEAVVEVALRHMSQARRAVYVESVFTGLPLKEVAELTGLSPRAVLGHKVDANRIVREAVRAHEEDRSARLPKRGRPRRRAETPPAPGGADQ